MIDPRISDLNLRPSRGYRGLDCSVVGPIGHELLHGTGLAVVSAWQCLPGVFPSPPANPGRKTLERLFHAVSGDVGVKNSARGLPRLYECFFEAYGFYGVDWALPSLASHLEWCGWNLHKPDQQPERKASDAWTRAVRAYEQALMLK